MVLCAYMHDLTPFLYGHPFSAPFLALALPLLAVALVWTIILKGFALWHAARGSQKWWFIALLVINTLGILEIVYLIWFRPQSSTHVEPPVHHSSPAAE